jgi:hypothetical protein
MHWNLSCPCPGTLLVLKLALFVVCFWSCVVYGLADIEPLRTSNAYMYMSVL